MSAICDKSMHCWIVAGLLGLLLCCSPPDQVPGFTREPPAMIESSRLIDGSVFNDSIAAAVREGRRWPRDPIRVAQEFIGYVGPRSVYITREDYPGERADSTTVIIIEDGHLDDSLRGTWHRFRLARSTDDTWYIAEVRRAYRCWRGHHPDSYSRELCP
jgi:hypothetical protein